MSSTNWFSNLKLDAWYKIFVLIGGIGFLFSLFLPINPITNKQAMFFCLGIMLVGLGEWKNNKIHVQHWDETAFNREQWIQTPIRKPDALGNFLLILGIIVVVISILDILNIVSIFEN